MAQQPDSFSHRRRLLRLGHSIWAMLGFAACCVLIFAPGEGHPPAIVFLPVAIVVWVLGHGSLWLIGRLLARGDARATRDDLSLTSWPPALLLITAGAGLTTVLGGFGLMLSLVSARPGTAFEWVFVSLLVVWFAHATCFASLLLRRSWSAFYAAVICFGWVLLMGAQIADTVVRGYPIHAGELVIALALIAVGVLFGRHLMTSRRIKQFLSVPIPD